MASKRAHEILELPEDEELDMYEPEHQMAFAQAAHEIAAQVHDVQAQQKK